MLTSTVTSKRDLSCTVLMIDAAEALSRSELSDQVLYHIWPSTPNIPSLITIANLFLTLSFIRRSHRTVTGNRARMKSVNDAGRLVECQLGHV